MNRLVGFLLFGYFTVNRLESQYLRIINRSQLIVNISTLVRRCDRKHL